MPLITGLFVLLACAHVLGRICVRLKQPALAGHMIAGIVLGPSLLEWLAPSPSLSTASDLSVLFVVLTAGLEMRLRHIVEVFRGRGAFAMLIGFLVPGIAGGVVANMFDVATIPAIVVALCVAVTALPIALQILGSFGLLQTRIGRVSIAGALLADILVLMILGVLIQLAQADAQGTFNASVALACAKLIGLMTTVVLAQWACRFAIKRGWSAGIDSAGKFVIALSLVMLFVFGMGSASELLGFHFVIGAFFAAMMVTPEVIGESSFDRLKQTSEGLTLAVFGPLFLAYQGLQFHLQALTHPAFVIVLTLVAVAAKLIAGYVAARLQRMNHHDALGVGIVMNTRGVMELVVASIAFRASLIDAEVFSVLLAMGLVTTAITPFLLQRWQAAAAATNAGESARIS